MQQDLFDSGIPQAIGHLSPKKSTFLERFRISLRFEHALLVGIVLIIVFALFFSFGVENGKYHNATAIQNERIAQSERIEALQREIMHLQKQQEIVQAQQVLVQAEKKRSAPEKTGVGSPGSHSNDLAFVQKPHGNYTIQTLTYKTETAAQRQMARYKEMGLSSFVIPSGAYIQVCVNAFESRSTAVKELRHMKIRGEIPSDAFVRAIPHA